MRFRLCALIPAATFAIAMSFQAVAGILPEPTGLRPHARSIDTFVPGEPPIITVAAAGQAAPESEPQASPSQNADDDDPVDPRAIDALLAMGRELISLDEFAVKLDATVDQVMDDGQKIQFGGVATYRVHRPDRLRVDLDTDTGARSYFYNGKTLTLFTPSSGFYGTADAKPTIRETIDWAEETYGLEVPIADLFDWGTDRAPIDEIKDATSAGTARVNGVLCAHFALRTSEVDWEIWIETGDRPLPLKFAVTDKTQEALPRFETTLTWSTDEHFDDGIFQFSPPPDAKSIPLAPLAKLAKLSRE